ncbi:hypothetical protein H9L19_06695 [Weissella diestrammenae]|uniref:Uncharacterized protein n=1 Tax=Weissella diestrammenae TaxID=1162633 RepID=A0A7G9T4N5_9LACO|nr:hypothetical protein [Weissella diestrammenae]MCM0582161.1 hypothetical protein [Weissella diestrammenae]QNN75060.1 hypothetical protein H9L19_06695 [Weissella diestrammenae]
MTAETAINIIVTAAKNNLGVYIAPESFVKNGERQHILIFNGRVQGNSIIGGQRVINANDAVRILSEMVIYEDEIKGLVACQQN